MSLDGNLPHPHVREGHGPRCDTARPVNFVPCRLGHASILPTLTYIELVPYPTGSQASVP